MPLLGKRVGEGGSVRGKKEKVGRGGRGEGKRERERGVGENERRSDDGGDASKPTKVGKKGRRRGKLRGRIDPRRRKGGPPLLSERRLGARVLPISLPLLEGRQKFVSGNQRTRVPSSHHWPSLSTLCLSFGS